MGVGPDRENVVSALLRRGVDVIVVDTSHGHSKNVMDTIRDIKRNFSNAQVIGGNVATAEAVEDLVKAGVDGVKLGWPRLHLHYAHSCRSRRPSDKRYHGVCEKSRGAWGAPHCRWRHQVLRRHHQGIGPQGAHTVIDGGLFAGTDESPGEMVLYQGRSYKSYPWDGVVLEAMREGSRNRYGQHEGVWEKTGSGRYSGDGSGKGPCGQLREPTDRRTQSRYGIPWGPES